MGEKRGGGIEEYLNPPHGNDAKRKEKVGQPCMLTDQLHEKESS